MVALAPPVQNEQLAPATAIAPGGQPDQNEMEKVRAYISTLPPEQQQEYLQKLGTDFGSAAGDAQKDMSRADRLRMRQPGGQTTNGIYTAANPLEHLAAMGMNIRADNRYEEGQGRRDSSRVEEGMLRSQIMRQMAGQ
jgi:hypothetical protein